MIKHLVIAGGGTLTLRSLGSLQYLLEQKMIEYDNIKSIYGTSAGAIIGVCICLKMEIHLLVNYFVNRPWEDLYEITPSHIYNLYSKKGIFDKDSIIKLMEPLFEYNNIPLDITLEEFYKINNIDLHIFSIELNDLNVVDISHETFPQLSLIDALCMTSCLPIAFEPFMVNDIYYVDPGFVVNYPLSYCLYNLANLKGSELNDNDKSEILGLNTNQESMDEKTTSEIIRESNLIAYSLFIMGKLIKKNYTDHPCEVANTITYFSQESTFSSLFESISSSEKREEYIREGTESAIQFAKIISIC